jgi:hypothetical protein
MEKKRKVSSILDYYIKQKHCRPNGERTHLKLMCENCRNMNYLQATLKKIKAEVLKVI